MPKIRIRFFANFRELTKTKDLEMEGDTVRDILAKIIYKFPEIKNIIFEREKLQPHVNVFLNGINIIESGGLDRPLKNEDEIAIFPPVSGGRCSRKE